MSDSKKKIKKTSLSKKSTKKKATPKKTAVKKTAPKKLETKKPVSKKTTVKKSSAKKVISNKPVAKKPIAKKLEPKKVIQAKKTESDNFRNLSHEEIIQKVISQQDNFETKSNKKINFTKILIFVFIIGIGFLIYKLITNRNQTTVKMQKINRTEIPLEKNNSITEQKSEKIENKEISNNETTQNKERQVEQEKPITDPETLEIKKIHIFFSKSSGWVNHREREKLSKIFNYLEANPERKLIIFGNSCDLGSIAVNNSLALFRAKNVKKYLIKKEIEPGRLLIGKIESKKLNMDTESERKKHRTVSFEIK